MIFGGISIKGSYHKENQDSFLAKKNGKKVILVVSDGLGSKTRSKYGSRALCDSVYEYVKKNKLLSKDQSEIFAGIYKIWKSKVKHLGIKNCYATSLIMIYDRKKIYLFRLGDGCILLKTDKQNYILRDKKENSFSNETDSLSERIDYKRIESLVIKNERIKGIILFTDGLNISPEEDIVYNNFLEDFIKEYKRKVKAKVNLDIVKWLSNWPNSDDKTIAYYI